MNLDARSRIVARVYLRRLTMRIAAMTSASMKPTTCQPDMSRITLPYSGLTATVRIRIRAPQVAGESGSAFHASAFDHANQRADILSLRRVSASVHHLEADLLART